MDKRGHHRSEIGAVSEDRGIPHLDWEGGRGGGGKETNKEEKRGNKRE